ncbi:MAG: 50S ribosomal protein L3 [Kiritimatiellae bacterium]|nr:50S ribosomal protein L3 [Kiritimatiellia bacterium]MBQ3342163.1 50S ribosomal protein L3 [Kiritimatiellia bacterium]
MEGLIGKKVGMTQVFDADGRRVCVTVIEVGPCPVVQVKTLERDGYVAAQLGFGEQKAKRLTKAVCGHQEKTGGLKDSKVRVLREFAPDAGEEVKVGDVITVANFEGVKYVDVTGVTKGKGFAGVLKRYNFAGGNMTHGGHSKRRTGGLAARDLPGWIEKGKKMPGHMGDVNRKITNLEVVQVRPDDNALLVKGSIPGARNGIVIVRKSLKNNVIAARAKKGA